jgi:hypothetical protein
VNCPSNSGEYLAFHLNMIVLVPLAGVAVHAATAPGAASCGGYGAGCIKTCWVVGVLLALIASHDGTPLL